MKMTRAWQWLAMSVLGCLWGVVPLSQAITVTDVSTVVGPRTSNIGTGVPYTITVANWSLAGGNAVAVVFAAENASDTTVKFGGHAMTVVSTQNGNHHAAIAYLIDPPISSGDIEIVALGTGKRMSHAYSVFSLADVAGIAGSGTQTTAGSLSYTTSLDNGYVLGVAENNAYNGPAPTISGNPDVIALQQAVDGNCSILIAHGSVADAGAYSDTYGGSVSVAATVAFDSPLVVSWGSTYAPTDITTNAATLSADLEGLDSDLTLYWEAGSVADPEAFTGWDGTNGPTAETTGTVSRSISGLEAGTLYSYAFFATNAASGSTAWSSVGTFTTLARPVVESFADDKLGGPIVPDTLVTYTVTFSKTMDGGTISSASFTNAGSSAVTFGTVSTVDEVVTVEVTPTGDGTLRLGIKAGATVKDSEGIPLDTSSAVLDDTTISVSSSSPPAVVNSDVGAVGIETATLQGQITASNGVLQDVRFYLGTTDENQVAGAWDTNIVVAIGSITEGVDFTAGASDLVAGTEYFYRVYASNATEAAWSDVAGFTTLSEAVWTNDANGSWSDTGNWTNGVAGFGGYPARFDTLTLGAARTVTLDTAATVGSLVFGDVGNAYGWTLTPDAAQILTLSGVAGIEVVNQSATMAAGIGGTAGLTKSGTGTLVLSGVNSYTGATGVDVGTLQVDGSLDAGSAVTVASGATLRGAGTVGGAVTLASGGTLSAGSAATRGSLAIGGALALDAGSTVVLRVNKSGSTLTSDLIDPVGAMAYAGTLTVTHSGDALVAGDSFTLFDAASYSGMFGTVNLPALDTDLQWDYSGLTVDGSVVVFSTSLTLDGTSGSSQHAGTYSTGGSQATGQGLSIDLGFFVDYLIVGGGGGGGARYFSRTGGGGGAGGLLAGSTSLAVGDYAITVGDGGNGSTSIPGNDGQNGGDSSIATIGTGTGGGRGGNNTGNANSGGSGGGGSGTSAGGSGASGQGFDGGDSSDGSNDTASGGGGAGGPGQSDVAGSAGGAGVASSITGTLVTYAGGGDGGRSDTAPTNGGDNSGGGGDGGGSDVGPGGNGGSGIVIIRYPGASIPTAGGTITSFTGNGTIGENGVEYQVHSFTNVGADTFDISSLDLDARLGAEITTAISGEGDLVFNGPGTLTLSGDSTYTGDTIISNGTLLVTGSLAAGSDVTVKSGASLGGSGGTISGNVTFETGSTFAANGTLTIGGTLTIQSGATLDYSGSATTLATYAAIIGTFDTELNIPDGFNLEYGANTLKMVSLGGSVFRFR